MAPDGHDRLLPEQRNGVAVRELVTNGVIEAKKQGTTLSGVEWQTVKYQANVPDALPAYLFDHRLPFGYESTGAETLRARMPHMPELDDEPSWLRDTGDVQHVYSMLRGDPELAEDVDETSSYELVPDRPVEVDYQPELPCNCAGRTPASSTHDEGFARTRSTSRERRWALLSAWDQTAVTVARG